MYSANGSGSGTADNVTRVKACLICKKLSSLKCSKCREAFYCSAEHQRLHWKQHKLNCLAFEVSVVDGSHKGAGLPSLIVKCLCLCRWPEMKSSADTWWRAVIYERAKWFSEKSRWFVDHRRSRAPCALCAYKG